MRYIKFNCHHAIEDRDAEQHAHAHDHGAGGGLADDRVVKLLRYMHEHNCEHCDELASYCENVQGAAHGLLHKSVDALRESNAYLEEAVALLERGE